MSEDRKARPAGDRASDDGTLPSPAAESSEVPSSASGDSFLREAAQVSEPTPSEVAGFAAGPARAGFLAGEVVAKRYRLDRELGRGGMGVVWEATHLITRRRVAIKFVLGPAHQRADLRRRFLREARAASAANHPNVVEVHDVFELDDGTPVMVMELLVRRDPPGPARARTDAVARGDGVDRAARDRRCGDGARAGDRASGP